MAALVLPAWETVSPQSKRKDPGQLEGRGSEDAVNEGWEMMGTWSQEGLLEEVVQDLQLGGG